MDLISGRYELVEKLGSGGMGTVYRAYDRLYQEEVALKRVTVKADNLTFNTIQYPELQNMQTTIADNRLTLAREFRTMASLHHPNIINVLDYGFDEGQPYYTMTLLRDGREVDEAGREAGHVEKINLLIQILQALVYLHRRGIIHRDLKPGNILVTPDKRVKLLDFGLAMRNPEQTEIVGTLMYMAPEVLRREPITPATDLYAVGVIAYEFFVGLHPFDTSDTRQFILDTVKRAPDLSLIPDDLRDPTDTFSEDERIKLSAIIGKLLAKKPSERYQDAYTVMGDLCEAIGRRMPDDTSDIRDSLLHAAAFIGREDELNQLVDALEHVKNDEGSVWLIGAESGVGKSRLMDELRTHAMVDGILVLSGQCVLEGGLPYELWREPARRLVLQTEVNNRDASILRELVPDISTLLNRDIPSASVLTTQEGHHRLAITLLNLLDHYNRPVVMLLEDLQWASSSLSILRTISQVAPHRPWLIVASYRNNVRPSLPDELPGSQVMHLQTLDHDAVAELSESVLGSSGRNPEVISLLKRETDGNAFFILQVLRELVEDAGGLQQIGSRTLPDDLFTGGIHQIVGRRLKRIPSEGQWMLKLAAVIGRNIDLNVLLTASESLQSQGIEPVIDLNDWLTMCVDGEIVVFMNGFWRFVHDKFREDLLHQIKDDEKPIIYRAVALAIEQVYAGHLQEYAGTLMHLWRTTGDPQKEAHYTAIAAGQAYDMSHYKEAKTLYQRLMALETDPHLLADTYYGLGISAIALSDYDESRQWSQKSLELYRELRHQLGEADALAALAEADLRQGKNEQARPFITQSMRLYSNLNRPTKLAYAYLNLGILEEQEGHSHEAKTLFESAYEMMRENGEPIDIAYALNYLGLINNILNHDDLAMTYFNHSLKIQREINDQRGIASSLINIGMVCIERHQHEDARTYLMQALEILMDIGEKAMTAAAYDGLGTIAFHLGDYNDALQYFRKSLRLSQEIGNLSGIARELRRLGDLSYETGEYPVARKDYQKALKTAVSADNFPEILDILMSLAHIQTQEGHFKQAVVMLSFVRQQKLVDGNPVDEVEKRLHELQPSLPTEIYEKMLEQGQSLTYEDVVAALLEA